MSTTILLLLSAALIGSGVILVWRDLHATRRTGAALSQDAKKPPVAAAQTDRSEAGSLSGSSGSDAPLPGEKLGALLLGPSRASRAEPEPPKPDSNRPAATAQQWSALQPVISAAVEQVNAVLAKAGLAIGGSEQPTWGSNRSYGADRPIVARGRGFATLRLACTPGGRLDVSVVALDDKPAGEINGEASAPASGASIGRVSDLLSECLKPATAYALRNRAERRAQEGDWRAIEPIVAAAMNVANGAILEAGARLVPVAASVWYPAQGLHRMPVSIQMFGRDIARMHIDRLGEEVEVAVGTPDARLASLGRRERLAVDGMTAHALAELIAACTWPAIAHDRETR